jgi:tellurite resistance protein TerC
LSLGVIIVTLIITTVASLYKTRVHDVKKAAGSDEESQESLDTR